MPSSDDLPESAPRPTPPTERVQRAFALFADLVALAPEDRARRLAALDDAATRAEVEAMLAQDAGGARITVGGGLAALEAAGPVPLAANAAERATALPVLRGQYRILRVLGEGGMGIVYEAEQALPKRRVALKALRTGAASRRALARLEREAHILGRLHHENIARVYEAGVDDADRGEQAYIAMELVDGPPITHFAEREHLELRPRIELFLRVCAAVQHAHERGVIHRDLKPSNVLVDPSGAPKVLDFGVARLADADSSAVSTFAGQLVGTLAYMSPEQVEGDPDAIDTRTDVYALGALLYELLTGSTPVTIDARTLPEMILQVRDGRPRPLRERLPSAPRDVESILARALERDRARRYASAVELAQDLRRHLDGEPVLARGDTGLYVLGRQLARHRKVTATAFASVALLVAFALWSQSRAKTESELRQKSDEASLALAAALRQSNLERGRLHAANGNLSEAEALLWDAHLTKPDVLSRWALWSLYSTFPCVRTFGGEREVAMTMALAPDGRTLATGTHEGDVRLWDVERGELLRAMPRTKGMTNTASWSADGSSLAVGDQSGRVTVFDARSGDVRWTWKGGGNLLAVRFSPSGKKLAVCGEFAAVHVLDTLTGAPVGESTIDASSARSLDWLHGDEEVVACPSSANLLVFDAAGKRPARAIPIPGRELRAIAVGPGAEELTVGDSNGDVLVAALGEDREPVVLHTGVGSVRTLEFDAARHKLLVCGTRHTEVWDVEQRLCAGTREQRRQPIFAAAFAHGGERVVTGGSDGPLRVWDVEDAGLLRPLGKRLKSGGPLIVSGDGASAFYNDEAWVLHEADLATGAERGAWPLATTEVYSFAWDPRRKRLYFATAGRVVGAFSLEERRVVLQREFTDEEYDSLAFSAPRDRLVGVGSRGVVTEFDPDTLETRAELRDERLKSGAQLALAPDGRHAATTHFGKHVALWDLAGGGPARVLDAPEAVFAVAWVPHSPWLAVGGWRGAVELWNTETGALERTLTGHTQWVRNLAVSADGAYLASSSADGVVALWDPKVAAPLLTFERSVVTNGLRFAPNDGRILVSGVGGPSWIDLHACDERVEGNEPYQRARRAAPH